MEPKKYIYDKIKEKVKPRVDYQVIIKQGSKFTDTAFPANNDKSIIDKPHSKSEVDIKDFKKSEENWKGKIVWKRPEDIFLGGHVLFRKKTTPYQVQQGGLGTCYFLSSISALAAYTNRIQEIFITKEKNKAGCYALRVYISGLLGTVVVDDFLPCMMYTNMLAFTRAFKNDIWVLLLEKAWAKINHNYYNIEEGSMLESFSFLTGAPTSYLCADDLSKTTEELKRKIWYKIYTAVTQFNYLVASSATQVEGTTEEDYKNVGLVSYHAYSVVSAKYLEYRGTELRLLKIRNPWGSKTWNGPYSDESPLWTDELKKYVNFDTKDKGTFFMSMNDYVKYFSYTYICKYHDNYFSGSFCVVQKPNEFNVFTFRLDAPLTHGFITVYQIEKRFMRTENYNYQYSNVHFLLAKYDKKGTLTYEGIEYSNNKNQSTVELNLQAGTYIFYVAISWNNTTDNCQYCINTFTSNQIQMFKIENISEFHLVSEILKSRCRSKKVKPEPLSYTDPGVLYFHKIDTDFGFTFDYIQYPKQYNSNKSIKYTEIINATQGLSLMNPSGGDRIELEINEKSDAIAIWKIISYPCKLRTSYLLSYSAIYNDSQKNISEFWRKLKIEVEYAYYKPPIIMAIRMPSEMHRLGSQSMVELDSLFENNNEKIKPKKEKIIIKITDCPKKHGLKLFINNENEAKFICSNCKKENFEKFGVYKCDLCKFYACSDCVLKSTKQKLAMNDSALKCHNNHNLVKFIPIESNVNFHYMCDQCQGLYKNNIGKLFCEKCDFNICPKCQRELEENLQKLNKNKGKISQKLIFTTFSIILNSYLKFLKIEDFLVLLTTNGNIYRILALLNPNNILPQICTLATRNGQNQYREWLEKTLFCKRIPNYINEDYYKIWKKDTKNYIMNSDFCDGFEYWNFERKENSWQLNTQYPHLPQYFKNRFCLVGSNNPCKISQAIKCEQFGSILEKNNCILSTGAYISRPSSHDFIFEIKITIFDSHGKILKNESNNNSLNYTLTKSISANKNIRSYGLNGEKYEYKFIEISLDNDKILNQANTILFEFSTISKSKEAWKGAIVADPFLRIIPKKYFS